MLEARPPVLRPRPLGESAVARLVRDSLGDDASDGVVPRVRRGDRRQPVPALGAARRVPPRCAPGQRDRPTGGRPAGAGTHRRRRAAAGQPTRSAGPCAGAGGRGAGRTGPPDDVRRAGRIGRPKGEHAWPPALVDLAVLVGGEPLRFVHPIVRTAIYNDLSATERADLHARAAKLLADQRADPGAIAVHLIATPPSGDRNVVAMLREAARSALAGGAPGHRGRAAAQGARRATRLRRSSIGACSSSAMPNTRSATRLAPTHLREAGETATDPLIRARAFDRAGVDDASRTRGANASNFRSTSGRPPKSGPTIASSRCSSMRRGWAPCCSTRICPTSSKPKPTAFADLPALTAAECLLRSFRRPQSARGRPDRRSRRSRRAGRDASRLGKPGWSSAVAHEHHHLLGRSRALRGRRAHPLRVPCGTPSATARRSGWPGRPWLRGLARHRRGDLRAAEVDARSGR